jgi:hypothetical protein
MDIKFLAYTVRNLILDPMKEWDVIHSENRSASFFSRSLLLPLLFLASVSSFLGAFLFTNTELGNAWSVLKGVRFFAVVIIATYGTAFILSEITAFIGIRRDFSISFRIIVCSIVPFILCQIVSQLLESFIFVNILSAFGLYIMWNGITKMLDPAEGKKLTLMIGATVAFIALFLIASSVMTSLTDKIYFSFFA